MSLGTLFGTVVFCKTTQRFILSIDLYLMQCVIMMKTEGYLWLIVHFRRRTSTRRRHSLSASGSDRVYLKHPGMR